MTVKDKVDLINTEYHNSTEPDALLSAATRLEEILKSGVLSDEYGKNRSNADALFYRIKTKALVIKYFADGYYEEDYAVLSSFIEESLIKIADCEYVKTQKLLKSVSGFSKAVRDCIAPVSEALKYLFDGEELLVKNAEELKGYINSFGEIRDKLCALPNTEEVFGGIKIPDLKQQAISDVAAEIKRLSDTERNISEEELKDFFAKNVKSLDEEEGDKFFDYHAGLIDRKREHAGVLVLFSPLKDEVILFTRAVSKDLKEEFVTFSAYSFDGLSANFIDRVFDRLIKDKKNCLIFDFSTYKGANRKELIAGVAAYGKAGRTAIVSSAAGDRKDYEEIYSFVNAADGYSVLDVSYKYLTMPPLKEVLSVFEEKGMITPADYEKIKRETAFMGYVGLNRAITLFIQKKEWKSVAAALSERHRAASLSYVKKLSSQTQFIDFAWVDLELERKANRVKREFDYDAIKVVDQNIVKKILNAKITLFEKCGLIARYCTLSGEDVSVWQRLSREEKSARLTEASKLVAYILGNEYEPEIKVVPENEWTSKGAGGLCCDGGKLILYREDCCDDYDWTIKAVCHECFHGFQHTLVNNGWQDWCFEELGITKNRIPEWRYNFDHYSGNTSSKTYKVEIVECDARSFENDCFDDSAGILNTLDLG